ncbi:MAG TPA: protein kinase [Bryobacteraceae bacterium]|nr:protein kinase [Bryobacteraceae bacterium]
METIGKYRIIGALGKGGFGHVYKAEDPTIGNIVAIKVLNVQNDENMIRRFRAEAVTSARLRHKNIVTIFDFEEQNGTPYLVMEYLDGENLQLLVEKRSAIPIIDKLSIMAEVAEGLQYAHEHGVIHRDIKPANIMRLSDGSVKIMDFGIARLTQRNTRLTAVGYIVGTPEYMAPEQFMGDSTDAQSDVWSFGVVLYEFLTGKNPFAADTPGAIIYRVTNEDPPSVCDKVSQLPRSFDPVMRRLLTRKKSDRYPNMDDLRVDLGMVIQEFGEGQIAGMEKDTESLIRAARYDDALAMAARILKFDHRNSKARKWRTELRDVARRQKDEVRLKNLIEEADEKTTALDFSAAEARLKEALQIDPDNSEVRARLDQINVVREKKARALNLLADARVELDRQNLTGAFEHANEAAQNDPGNSDAADLLNQIQQAIERRNSEARRKTGLSRARGQLLVQDYANAVNTLQELARQYTGDPEVHTRLEEAQRLQAVDATEKTVAAAIAKSRDYLLKGAFQEAIDLLTGLDREAGRNVQVLQLLNYARDQRDQQEREAEIDKLLAGASAAQTDYDRALALIASALELSPGNEKAIRLRKAVLADRQREEQNKAIEGELKECRELIDEGRLEQAETRARALWKRHPDSAGVQQIIRELGERFRQREEAIEREVESRKTELERLLDRGDVDAADTLLQTLSVRYQRDNLFADLARRIAHLQSEKRERDAVNAALANAQRFADAASWEDALKAVDQGLQLYPKSVPLLARRDRIVQQTEVQAAADQIEPKMAAGDWDSVTALAESGLRKFPGEPRLLEFRQKAREQREGMELLARAQNLLAAGDLAEAAKSIGELARRGWPDRDVSALRKTLDAKKQRQQSLASADQLRKRFSFQQARDAVQGVLKDDPQDADALTLLEAVDREEGAYVRSQKVAAARAEASQFSKQKQYDEAVRVLTGIDREYPGDFEIEYDLHHALDARDQAARREAYLQGRTQLATLVRNRQFDEAVQKAEDLLAKFPDETEMADELRRVRESRDQAARKQEYEQGRREVQELMKHRQFEEAVTRLQEMARAFPDEPQLEEDLRRAVDHRDQAARKEAWAKERDSLHALMKSRKFEQAVTQAEGLLATFPHEPELLDILDRARQSRDQAARKKAYAESRKELDALLKGSQFDQAIDRTRRLMSTYPDEVELQDFLRRAMEGRGQAARQEAYSLGRKDFEELLWNRDFEEAISAVEQLIETFPEEPELKEDWRRACAARDQAQRKTAYARRRDGFEALMADRQFDMAVAAVEGLVRDFPDEPELPEFLRRAREARDEAVRKDAYLRDRRKFEALLRESKLDQAVSAAQKLVSAFPEEKEAAELLNNAQRARYRQSFDALMRDRKFDEAVDAARKMISAFPEEKEVSELVQRAQDARHQAAYATESEAFYALMRDSKFDEAVAAARKMVSAFPDQEEPSEFVLLAEDARHQAAYARERDSFEVLLSSGKIEQAVAAGQKMVAAFPGEKQAQELLKRAEYGRDRQTFDALMREAKFDQAVAAAQKIVSAFPAEKEAPELLHRAQEARDRAAREGAYTRDRQAFDALMRDSKFGQAVAAAQKIVLAFPEEKEAPELLRRAEYGRDRQTFDALMRDSKFDQAVAAAQKLVSAFPEEKEAPELLRTAQEARDRAARKDAYGRDRQAFDALIRDSKFDRAVAAAQKLLSEFPEEGEAPELLRSAREARDRAARKDAYGRDRHALDALMRDSKFDQAVAAAQKLVSAFPEEKEAPELLRSAQEARDRAARKDAYGRDRQSFDALMRDSKFDHAVAAAQKLVSAFPEEKEAPELLRSAQEGRERAARKDAYGRDRQALDALMRDSKFDQAVAAAQKLVSAFPEEKEAPELLRSAQEARDRAARKDAYGRDRQALDALMRDSKFDQAVAAAQKLVSAFPEEKESSDLLRRARQARDRQNFEVLMRDRKFDQAVAAAQKLVVAFPGEKENTELLHRALEARDQAARADAYKRDRQNVDALMRDAKFDQAITAAQSLVSAFPEEKQAPALLQHAQEARDQAARKARDRQSVETLLRDGKFDQAVAAAQKLLSAFPEEEETSDLLRRSQQARDEAARKEAYARDRQAFDVLLRDGKFDQAVAAAQKLLSAFPEEKETSDLLRRAQQARDQAARKEAYARDRQALDVLLRDGKFDQAVAAAQKLLSAFPEEKETSDLLRRSQQARDEAARKEAYARDRQAFDVLMRNGKFDQAVAAAQKLLSEFPEDKDAPELLRNAQNARDRQSFEALMRDGKFEPAVAAAQKLLSAFPEDKDAPELLRRAQESLSQAELKAVYTRARQEFEVLLANLQFDSAVAKAEELAAAFPAEPEAPLDLERARIARDRAARQAAIDKGRKEIDSAIRKRQFDRAVGKAQELAAAYPEETGPRDDLKRATEARDLAAREAECDRGRKEFDVLLKNGRLEEALQKADALAKAFPEQPAVQQDLQSARAAIEARRREAELARVAADALQRATELRQQRAISEALDLVQKTIRETGARPGMRELEEQLLADQARARLAHETLDKARAAMEQGRVETAAKLASELDTNFAGEVDTQQLRAAIEAKTRELQTHAAIEKFAREAETLRTQGRFDEALQSLDAALREHPGAQPLTAARARIENEKQEGARKRAHEQALAEISALTLSVPSAADESSLNEMVARSEAIAAAYPSDKQFKQAAATIGKAAKRRRTDWRQVSTPAPPDRSPISPQRMALAGGVSALVLGGVLFWWLGGSHSATLQISTTPAGAKVTVGSQTCTTPQCSLKLPPGSYEIRTEKPGYAPVSTTKQIEKGAPAQVALTLTPLAAHLSVSANFTRAAVKFDGSDVGQLRNGDFNLNSVPEGTHSLDIRSGDGEASLRFAYTAGQAPQILDPPSGKQIHALVVSGYGPTAEVTCDCSAGDVSLDGKSAGQLKDHRAALTGVTLGTHQVRVSAPDGVRESVVTLQDNPTLNLFVAADLDVGTLVVETGQDDVRVLLDNRPQPTLTHDGLLRIPVPSKQYSVSVEKQGFGTPAPKSIEVKKGELARVSFALAPLQASLAIHQGSPGIRVLIDGQNAGVTGADGSLRIDNIKPGSHTIDLTKDGFTPVHLNSFQFAPGGTIGLTREAQLVALPPPAPAPTAAQPTPPAPKTAPAPDPRALEAEEWNRLQNSHDLNQLADFQRKYPADAYTAQAASRIEQVEWDNLQNNPDPAALEAFANKYPKSDRAGQARSRAEQIDWTHVDKQNAAQIRAFLQRHPGNADATAALASADQSARSAGDKRAIVQVIAQYQQAFSSKDLNGILALRPSLKGTPTEKIIQDAFRQKQSIVLELQPLRDAEVTGDTAVIQCRQTTQQTIEGRASKQDVTVTITLARSGQSWIVKDIR